MYFEQLRVEQTSSGRQLTIILKASSLWDVDRTLEKAQDNKTLFWMFSSSFENYTEIQGISVITVDQRSRYEQCADDV